ncbi:MAG: hypothetical protein ABIA97_00990 [Candidatus Omnitrophota bacterium]
MNTFRKLFAINPNDIKEDVIITPFLNLEYFKKNEKSKINQGFIFSVLTEKKFSVIKTGMGSSFVGDSVVYLKDTPCQRLYFIGSCGIVSNSKVGDIVVVEKALAWESFSEILGKKFPQLFIKANSSLLQKFLALNKNIKKTNLATLGSLSLEEKLVNYLRGKKIEVVDMEVSAFLSATKYFKIPGLALLYTTDIIKNKPYFRELSKKDREEIKLARQEAISLLCDFIENLNA